MNFLKLKFFKFVDNPFKPNIKIKIDNILKWTYRPYTYIMVQLVLNPHGNFLESGFLVDGGGFYYIHQGNKSDKEKKL